MPQSASGLKFRPEDGLPEKQGLYDPELEKDSCGVGYVVSIDGIKSYRVSMLFPTTAPNIYTTLRYIDTASDKPSPYWSQREESSPQK
jgi:hypothetical protein